MNQKEVTKYMSYFYYHPVYGVGTCTGHDSGRMMLRFEWSNWSIRGECSWAVPKWASLFIIDLNKLSKAEKLILYNIAD